MNPPTFPCPRCGRPIPAVPHPTMIQCVVSRGQPDACNTSWRAATPPGLLALVRREPFGGEFIAAVRVLNAQSPS